MSHLPCEARSHGYTPITRDACWNTLLTSFSSAGVKRPLQQQWGHERVQGTVEVEVG